MLSYPWWLGGKVSTCQSRQHRFDPSSRRPPGEGRGNPLQYPCRENPKVRGACWVTVLVVTKRARHDLVTKQKKFPDRIQKHRKFILNNVPKVTEPMVGRAEN